ncbi:MAG: ABC transporter permease subunit [Planctomycetaceae bacterium]
MRAYLAILKDSVREAMASRVLWVALIAIALVLLVLAPFAISSRTATELRSRELVDAERFVRRLDEMKAQPDTPAGHIWSLLSDDQRTQIGELVDPDTKPDSRWRRRSPNGMIVRNLNELLRSEDFDRPEAFAFVEVEDADMLAVNASAKDQRAAKNLRLLVAAFPKSIRLKDSTEIALTYAGRNVVGPLPLAPSELEPVVERILVVVVAGFLGFFGVFGSLLVTASIIPRTFEPGEIALLLSKPVNRPLLFLTKFFGGCMFTLVCATTLVVGVWMLLGIRMGIWEHKLLLCIPAYLFLFAIYYSVSAAAGAIWRNAVVSLVLVVVFWLVIFVVGVVKTALDRNVFRPLAVTEIIPAGDQLFAVNGERKLQIYRSDERVWEQQFKREQGGRSEMFSRFMFATAQFKPTIDAANDRIVAIEQVPSPFGTIGRGQLVIGLGDNDYEREPQGEVPDIAPRAFVDSTGRIVIPTRSGIYAFVGQPEAQRKSQQFFNRITAGLLGTSNKKAFQPIHRSDVPNWEGNFHVGTHAQSDTLLVYSGGAVHRVDKTEDGTYQLGLSKDFDTEDDAVFSIGGSHVTIAFANGNVKLLDLATLEEVVSDTLDDGIYPRASATSPDGSFSAVLTHGGKLRIYDLKKNQRIDWSPREDGNVSAATFGENGKLYIAGGRENVAVYDTSSFNRIEHYTVDGDWVTNLHDWFINPVYSLFPKPGQVNRFVTYLLTGERSRSLVDNRPLRDEPLSLQEDRLTFDVWQPLWRSGIFIGLMLLLSCVYVSRRDF